MFESYNESSENNESKEIKTALFEIRGYLQNHMIWESILPGEDIEEHAQNWINANAFLFKESFDELVSEYKREYPSNPRRLIEDYDRDPVAFRKLVLERMSGEGGMEKAA